MNKIKDSSFKKVIQYKKYKDIYDFSSIECRIALLFMIIINIVFYLSVKYQDSEYIISNYILHLDSICMSFIGFLGFIVTGLAILTGAISSTVVKKLQERSKIESLEKILLSFYLLGLVSAFIIVISLILHFINLLHYNSILLINITLLSFISYLIIFAILYAVKLIGNCLELFYIISNMQIVYDAKENKKVDLKQKYNNYRILALEKIILLNNQVSINDYANEIKKMIETDNMSEQEKNVCMEMHKKFFSK